MTWPRASRRLADQWFHGSRRAKLRTNRRHYDDLPTSSIAPPDAVRMGATACQPGDDKYGQCTPNNSMRDTTTREVPDLLHSVRGMSYSGLMTRARAAVGSAA